MLKIENLDMLNKPNVQHVAAKIRLKLCGHSLVFALSSTKSSADVSSGSDI